MPDSRHTHRRGLIAGLVALVAFGSAAVDMAAGGSILNPASVTPPPPAPVAATAPSDAGDVTRGQVRGGDLRDEDRFGRRGQLDRLDRRER